jgi:uncharacterized protein (TIGR00269 family)
MKIPLPNSGVELSKSDFLKYFEKKVNKTISKHSMIQKGDKIAVALSGGKDSTVLLYLLSKLSIKRHNKFTVEAIAIDEGIKDYRKKTLDFAKEFCKQLKIKLHIYTYEKEFSLTLDSMIKKSNNAPCNICGTFRRYLLNKYAKKLKFNKLATGHNLDDEAQSILMNYFKNNTAINARLGPITGIIKDASFIPRIKPLYFLTEKEVATFAFLMKFNLEYTECPNAADSFRNDIQTLLNDFESRYPGTKHSLVNSFLETLPLLKEKQKINATLLLCKICKEPSSNEICKSCLTLKEIKSSSC